MRVRLSTLTTIELEAASVTLANAAGLLRLFGDYRAAANIAARHAEIEQHLIMRATDDRMHKARQISLVPPGAYDPPA